MKFLKINYFTWYRHLFFEYRHQFVLQKALFSLLYSSLIWVSVNVKSLKCIALQEKKGWHFATGRRGKDHVSCHTFFIIHVRITAEIVFYVAMFNFLLWRIYSISRVNFCNYISDFLEFYIFINFRPCRVVCSYLWALSVRNLEL